MTELTLHSGERMERVLVDEPAIELHVRQEAGSSLFLHVVNFHASNCRIEVEQLGPGCTTEIYGLCLLRGEERALMHTNVRHLVGGGKSQQLVKFALDDKARGEFYGQLYIAPDAQQTEAYQTNRNLLLSDTAQMRTRPQLEIYADDVKASHGATTGRLDESSLFYMQQRCIDPETGRRLLLEAFLNEVVSTIGDEKKREETEERIAAELQQIR